MLFNQVVGQQHIKQKLVTMVAHNRLSHALLFLGKEGSGALPLALAFANYVCLQATPQVSSSSGASLFGEAQDTPAATPIPNTVAEADAFTLQHPGYSKVSNLIHPDIHYTYPVIIKKTGDKPLSSVYAKEWRAYLQEQPYGNSYDWLQYIKAENKQGNISAQECADIQHQLSLKSFESDYKILVLWMPEFLGNQGNKLLKLIEEPPPNTLFILVAENEEHILPTIISRTQLVKVPLAADEDIVQYLRDKTDVVQAMQVTGIAEGNIREALQLLLHQEHDWLQLAKDCFNAAKTHSPTLMVQWVTKCAELGREKQKQYLRYLIHLIECAIKATIMGKDVLQLTDADAQFVLKLVALLQVDALETLAVTFNNQIYSVERNANAKMLFHALIIRVHHIISNKNVILIQ